MKEALSIATVMTSWGSMLEFLAGREPVQEPTRPGPGLRHRIGHRDDGDTQALKVAAKVVGIDPDEEDPEEAYRFAHRLDWIAGSDAEFQAGLAAGLPRR